MRHFEVPSDDEVVATLGQFDGRHATALELCKALLEKGYSLQQSQLAIQRTSERRRIRVNSDWTLSVGDKELVAAA